MFGKDEEAWPNSKSIGKSVMEQSGVSVGAGRSDLGSVCGWIASNLGGESGAAMGDTQPLRPFLGHAP